MGLAPAGGFAAMIVLLYLPYLSVGWRVLGFLPDYVAENASSAARASISSICSTIWREVRSAGPGYTAIAVTILFIGALLVLLHPGRGVWLRGGFPGDGAAALHPRDTHHLGISSGSCPFSVLSLLARTDLDASSFILYATLGLSPPSRDLW